MLPLYGARNQERLMGRLETFVPEDRQHRILIFRWFVVLTSMLFIAYGQKDLTLAKAGYLVPAFFFISNLALSFAPRKLFDRVGFLAPIFGLDMAVLFLAILLAGGTRTDFYLLYFFVIFMALPTSSILVSATPALLASVVYALVIYRISGVTAVVETTFIVKVSFFFLLAISGSLISRQSKQLKSLEVETDKKGKEVSRKLEKARRSKEELYDDLLMLHTYNENILNSIESGVLVIDPEGTITAFNHGAETITGLNRNDVLFEKANTIETLRGFINLTERTREKPLKRQEIEIKTPSGEMRTIGTSTYLLTHGKKHVLGVIAVFADLTARKKLQKDLKESEGLALIGDIAGSVAQELKSPATAIRGLCDLIIAEARDKATATKYATMISKEAERIDRTIQQILIFAENKKTERNPLDTNSVMEEVIDSVKNIAQLAQTTITWQPGSDLPQISADKKQLQKAFTNIILSSIDAVGTGGKIEVITTKNKEGIVVELRDEGPGIPKETEGRISNPFIAIKNRESGLSLAAALKIVEDHDGTIRLESDPGKGAKFTIHLPLVPPKYQTVELPEHKATAPGKSLTVLVADGDAHMRDFYAEVLKTAGYNVLHAEDGKEAIKKLVGASIDLLVLDIRLPVLDGIEVIRHVSQISPGLPIIVCTDMKDDYAEGNSSIVAYLTKPVNVMEFKTRVEEALTGRSRKEKILVKS